MSPLFIALLLALSAAAGYIVLRQGKERVCGIWGCGYYRLSSRNEYTATAQSKPFRIAFGFFLFPYKRTQRIRESFYHFKRFVYETHTTAVFGKYLYRPLTAGVFRTASFMKRLQAGSIHLYIGYIFVALISVLLVFKNF